MKQPLVYTIFIFFTVQAFGQTIGIQKVKAKGDSLLERNIGENYRKLNPQFKKVRMTDRNDTYDYAEYKGENFQISASKEYSLTYLITYSDLGYQEEVELLLDSSFNILDSTAFTSIPDYIVNNVERDIILPDRAIELAKNNGLAKGDTSIVYLARHYKTREFYWHVESAWRKQLQEERKRNDGRRTRATNSHLVVNAKTEKVITWNEFGNL